ncbi:MAG: rhodanese-like domain-containing protein [Bdellovibrionales bacterium]
MEIGLFQLENLIHSNIRFSFLDLRTEFKDLPPVLELVLSRALRLGVKSLEDYLKKENLIKDAPVILLSENGIAAQAASKRLEAAGYTNVYVIEGGVDGLLSEL